MKKKNFECALCHGKFSIDEIVISPAQITCISCIYKLKEKKKIKDIVKQLEEQNVITKEHVCTKKDCPMREF